eukprot:gene2284-1426_t
MDAVLNGGNYNVQKRNDWGGEQREGARSRTFKKFGSFSVQYASFFVEWEGRPRDCGTSTQVLPAHGVFCHVFIVRVGSLPLCDKRERERLPRTQRMGEGKGISSFFFPAVSCTFSDSVSVYVSARLEQTSFQTAPLRSVQRASYFFETINPYSYLCDLGWGNLLVVNLFILTTYSLPSFLALLCLPPTPIPYSRWLLIIIIIIISPFFFFFFLGTMSLEESSSTSHIAQLTRRTSSRHSTQHRVTLPLPQCPWSPTLGTGTHLARLCDAFASDVALLLRLPTGDIQQIRLAPAPPFNLRPDLEKSIDDLEFTVPPPTAITPSNSQPQKEDDSLINIFMGHLAHRAPPLYNKYQVEGVCFTFVLRHGPKLPAEDLDDLLQGNILGFDATLKLYNEITCGITSRGFTTNPFEQFQDTLQLPGLDWCWVLSRHRPRLVAAAHADIDNAFRVALQPNPEIVPTPPPMPAYSLYFTEPSTIRQPSSYAMQHVPPACLSEPARRRLSAYAAHDGVELLVCYNDRPTPQVRQRRGEVLRRAQMPQLWKLFHSLIRPPVDALSVSRPLTGRQHRSSDWSRRPSEEDESNAAQTARAPRAPRGSALTRNSSGGASPQLPVWINTWSDETFNLESPASSSGRRTSSRIPATSSDAKNSAKGSREWHPSRVEVPRTRLSAEDKEVFRPLLRRRSASLPMRFSSFQRQHSNFVSEASSAVSSELDNETYYGSFSASSSVASIPWHMERMYTGDPSKNDFRIIFRGHGWESILERHTTVFVDAALRDVSSLINKAIPLSKKGEPLVKFIPIATSSAAMLMYRFPPSTPDAVLRRVDLAGQDLLDPHRYTNVWRLYQAFQMDHAEEKGEAANCPGDVFAFGTAAIRAAMQFPKEQPTREMEKKTKASDNVRRCSTSKPTTTTVLPPHPSFREFAYTHRIEINSNNYYLPPSRPPHTHRCPSTPHRTLFRLLPPLGAPPAHHHTEA